MKKMNMDQMQREVPVMIIRETLTIMDRRTGLIENRDFYRFGQCFPLPTVRKELDSYGYDIVGYQESSYVEGVIDMETMFATLNAEEVTA